MLLAAHVDLVKSKGSKVQGFVGVRSRRGRVFAASASGRTLSPEP